MQTRAVAALGLLLCATATQGAVIDPMVSKVETNTGAPAQRDNADGSAANPLSAYIGVSTSFKLSGMHLGEGDQVAWVANAERNCKVAGDANYPIFTLAKPTVDATTGVRQAATDAKSFPDAVAGTYKLCYRSKYPMTNGVDNGYAAWNYYGNKFGFQAVKVTAVNVDKAWTATETKPKFTGINLKADDTITYNHIASGADDKCASGTLATKTFAKLTGTGAELQTASNLAWTATTHKATEDEFLRICWAPSDAAKVSAASMTPVKMHVRVLDLDNMFYYVYPTVHLVKNTDETKLLGGPIRFGGWFFQAGDKISFTTTTGNPVTDGTYTLLPGDSYADAGGRGSVKFTLAADTKHGATGVSAADHKETFFMIEPVDLDGVQLKLPMVATATPGEAMKRFPYVTYVTRDDAPILNTITNDAGTDANKYRIPYVGNADHSGYKAAFLRGVEGYGYVKGLTRNGDSFYFVKKGGDCGVTADMYGSAVAVADGTWPEFKTTWLNKYYLATGGGVLCHKYATANQPAATLPNTVANAATEFNIENAKSVLLQKGDRVSIGTHEAVVTIVGAANSGGGTNTKITFAPAVAGLAADSDALKILETFASHPTVATTNEVKGLSNNGDETSGAATGAPAAVDAEDITTTNGINLFDGDKIVFADRLDNTYTISKVSSATKITVTPKIVTGGNVGNTVAILREFTVPTTLAAAKWYMGVGNVGMAHTLRFGAMQNAAAIVMERDAKQATTFTRGATTWSECMTKSTNAVTGAFFEYTNSQTKFSSFFPTTEITNAAVGAIPAFTPAGQYEVKAATEWTICLRVLSAANGEASSHVVTALKITQHPTIAMFPQTVKNDGPAAVSIAFGGFAAGDRIAFRGNAVAAANGLCLASGTLTTVDIAAKTSFTKTAADFDNANAKKLCIERATDTSKLYYFSGVGPLTMTSSAGAVLGTAFTRIYKGTKIDLDLALTDTVSGAGGVYIADTCTAGAAGVVPTLNTPTTDGTAVTDTAKIVGLSSGALSTAGKICQDDVQLAAGVTTIEVAVKCTHADAACGAAQSIGDTKYGTFSLVGDGDSKITFDVTNGGADSFMFMLSTDTNAKAQVVSGVAGQTAVALVFTAAPKVDPTTTFNAAAKGGVYKLYGRGGTAMDWLDTGKTHTVIKATAVYPPSAVKATSVNLYIQGADSGFSATDKMYLSSGTCSTTNVATAADTANTAVVSPAAFNTNDFKATFTLGTAAAGTYAVCFITASASAQTTAEYAKLTALSTVIKADETSQDTPNDAGTLRLNSGQAKTVTFATNTFQTGANALLITSGTACTGSPTAATTAGTTVTVATKVANSYTSSQYDVTATADTDLAKSTYKVCYASKASATTSFGVAATVIGVKLTSVEPAWLAKNAAEDQKLTLKVTAGDASDHLCIVKAGATAPTQAQCTAASGTMGVADITGTAPDMVATFPVNSVTGLTKDTDYDIYYTASGAPKPVLYAATKIRVVEPMTTPDKIKLTGTDKRVIYTDVDTNADGDFFYFAAAKTDILTKATKTAGSKLELDFTGATTVWFKSRIDSRTTDNADYYVKLTSNFATQALAITGHRRFHADVATTLTFSKTAQTVQPTDLYRVLAKDKTACATDTAAAAVLADATPVAFAGYKATPSATITITKTVDEHNACWAEGKAATKAYVDVPTSNKIIAMWAKSIWPTTLVASAAVYSAAADGAAPCSAFGGTNPACSPRVTITGHNIAQDDYLSFVDSAETDCAKAWWYEQALTSTNVDSNANVAADTTAFADFDIAAGFYKACVWGQNTLVGYNNYAAITLRVSDTHKVMPMFASSGITTKVSLMPKAATVAQAKFTADDRITFVTAGSADCADDKRDRAGADGVKNVTASSDVSYAFTAQATATTAGRAYTICADLDESVGYNSDPADLNSVKQFQVSGRLNAMAKITVFSRPQIGAIMPSSVIRNATAVTLTVHGGHLNAGDKIGFNTTAACGAQTGDVTLAGNTAELNMATVNTAFSSNDAGERTVCYKYSNASFTVDSSIKLQVVDLTSIAPTGNAPTTGTDGVKITFTGHFNQVADDDWVFLTEAKEEMKDCGKDVTAAWVRDHKRKLTITSATSAHAMFNVTSMTEAKEYRVCQHFGGTMWSADQMKDENIKMDYHLAKPEIVFSVRKINDFNPPSIVNNTAGQWLHFNGAGSRDYDRVAVVASTSTAVADCESSTTKATVMARKAELSVAAGSHKICYQFNVTDAATLPVATNPWVFVNSTATGGLLLAEDYILKSVEAPSAAVDIRDSVRVRVRGTGVAVGDLAKLIPTTEATNGVASCESATMGSSWQSVSASMEMTSRDDVWWTVPAGELTAAGKYVVCYKFKGASTSPISRFYNATGFQITYNEAPRVSGNYPRSFDTVASHQINVVGNLLKAGDMVGVVASTAAATIDCSKATKVGVNITTVNVTATATAPAYLYNVATATIAFAAEGEYDICYFFATTPATQATVAKGITISACNPTCTASAPFQCGCTCQATVCAAPAAPANPCGDSGFVFCKSSGVCARAPTECPKVPAVCPAGKTTRCPLGECVATPDDCETLAACPTGAVRCGDGSCAFGKCIFRSKEIPANACAGQEKCASGTCAPAGSCPPYNGCTVGEEQCSDCACRPAGTCMTALTSCKDPIRKYQCFDGSCRSKIEDCQCTKYSKIPDVVVSLLPGTRRRRARRFVTRANAKYSFDLGTLATITFDKDLTKADNCRAGITSVADNEVRSIEDPAKNTYVVTPAVGIAIVANGTAPCPLDETKAITLLFKVADVDTKVRTTSCQTVIAETTVTTTNDATDANKMTCIIKGPTHSAGATAIATGTLKTPPAAQTPSPSASVAPSGSVAPSASASPTATGSGDTTSAGSVSTVSTVLAAVLAVLVAALI